jgi:probable phosphoglycerate mutase
MLSMRVLLIRHGQTPSNVAGALDTAFPGAGLTPLGQVQAEAVPGALRGEAIGAVYASTLHRARLTAAPLADARGLTVQERPGVAEIAAGDLELKTDEDSVAAYVACIAAWLHGDLDRAMPGGPDGRAFLARYDAALRGIAGDRPDGGTVAVVSHGAAIRAYTALRTGMDPDEATKLRIMNTGMAVLDGDPGRPDAEWRLVSWHTEPLGGVDLVDPAAHDVTGESADEAAG